MNPHSEEYAIFLLAAFAIWGICILAGIMWVFMNNHRR